MKLVIYALLAAVLSLSGLVAYQFHTGGQSARQHRQEQAALNRRLKQVSVDNCLEIEALKTAQRQAATQNYQHLDANAKLLGIKVTPALRAAALKGRDKTLERFAAQSCQSPS
jgi:hypothetical protein